MSDVYSHPKNSHTSGVGDGVGDGVGCPWFGAVPVDTGRSGRHMAKLSTAPVPKSVTFIDTALVVSMSIDADC